MCILLILALILSTTPSFSATKKPARVKVQSVSSKQESTIIIKWKKVKCDGYRLQYSTDKKFKKSVKKSKVKKNKKSLTIKKLKNGKKYYFRVGAYNKNKETTKHGKWSKIKACTVHTHCYILKKSTKKASYYQCKCGKKYVKKVKKKVATVTPAEEGYVTPSFSPMKPSKAKSPADATGINSRGFVYNYRIFSQTAAAQNPNGDKYLAKHGCSTCSLTTILRIMVPEFANYTPRDVLTKVIKKVAGTKTYNANFKKSLDKQMPISLKGIDKVLTKYDVPHKFVHDYTAGNAKEMIMDHLKEGDPIIVMIAGDKPGPGVYSKYSHAMLLLGLDNDGKIIVGESAQQKSRWGASAYGLIKMGAEKNPDCNSITNIVKHLDSPAADISKKGFFYSSGKKGNIGFILINPKE